jgi:DHA1 family tetracycline resistance protein-like MFS transporter
MPGAPWRRAAFVFIFATILLDMLAIGIIIPVLPKLVVDFVGGDTEYAATIFGLFGTAWALMQFVFSPIQGALSDRFGRRAVILISNFGVGLDLRHHRGKHGHARNITRFGLSRRIITVSSD